jgi:ABC-type Mn2+/Zn2+ transport system ATPase subunit
LKDINLSVKKGKLVMIIGDIGSGKSSLLMAILNEMIHRKGSQVTLSGSIAYSSQRPWIMSETVEQNILFG